jgi:hypothetical protein
MFRYKQYSLKSANKHNPYCNLATNNALNNVYMNMSRAECKAYLESQTGNPVDASGNPVSSLPTNNTSTAANQKFNQYATGSSNTNSSFRSCRMKYAQTMRSFGTTEGSTSYPRKTCSIGGPTFSY